MIAASPLDCLGSVRLPWGIDGGGADRERQVGVIPALGQPGKAHCTPCGFPFSAGLNRAWTLRREGPTAHIIGDAVCAVGWYRPRPLALVAPSTLVHL